MVISFLKLIGRPRCCGALIALLNFMMATGCGKDEEKSERKALSFQNQDIILIQGQDTLSLNNEKISGTGKFAFVASLGSVDGGSSFDFSFSLEDGGSIKLISYADENLAQGIEYQLNRAGTELSMSYESNETSYELTSLLPKDDLNLNAEGISKIWVDVHNNESPLHTVIWVPTGLSKETTGEAEAFFNSEDLIRAEERESGTYSFPSSNGRGRFWGFELNKASLVNAMQAEPIYEEGEE